MELVVIGTPSAGPARVGERFRLRDGLPLLLGTASNARIAVRDVNPLEVVFRLEAGVASLEVVRGTGVSLRGVALPPATLRRLADGDCVFVGRELVLELQPSRPRPFARDAALERALVSAASTAWPVYADFLEEHGDPLGAWLRAAPTASAEAFQRQLRGLVEAHVSGELDVEWAPQGFLRTARLRRTDDARLAWLLAQLAGVSPARVLTRLELALHAGASPEAAEDQRAATALNLVRSLPCVGVLRHVSLGFVVEGRGWPLAEAAWAALKAVAPALEGSWAERAPAGLRARLRLEAATSTVSAAWTEVTLNPLRTDVGTAEACLARLVGDAPVVACSLHRTPQGEWVVFDERADPFRGAHGAWALRVNGAVTKRAVLRPGDVVEPVEGLRLRFEWLAG